ncbi:MAG: C-type lectin domain-containing protein [Deltaproteobacteria bacterium]
MPARGRAWIVCGCALQGCIAFASSKDGLEGNPTPAPVGAGAEVFSSIQDMGAPRLSAKPSGASLPAPEMPRNESADLGPIELLDAGPIELDTGPIELPDAGQLDEPEAEAPRPCTGPDEFPSSTGSTCYSWVAELLSWDHAQTACLEWGGALVRIDSAGEDQLLADHMSSDSWIGANDRSAEGAFRWLDATFLTFTNWAPGQPNNTADAENCVAKLSQSQQWNDLACINLHAHFCGRPLR